MAERELRGSRLLIAVALLGILCGMLAWRLLGDRSSHPRTEKVPSDAIVVSASGAADPAPALGLGTEISDGLDPSHLPGNQIVSSLRTAGVSILRFGDVGADDYDWERGCSIRDDARHPECGNRPGNGSSLDRFLQLAAATGVRPLIVVNGQIDDPQQAAALVGYYRRHCMRSASGARCPAPYWQIGFSPANWRHFAIPLRARRPIDASRILPDQYAALVIAYAAAMSVQDPHIQIVADQWITGATDQSWVAHVRAIDTHYTPFLYSPGLSPPAAPLVVGAVQAGTPGRPGIDSWLQDLRNSLGQFSNSDGIGIILGAWSIDANYTIEPPLYRGYVQALFAAEMFAHLQRDGARAAANPLIAAVQYPIIGDSQEPFDPESGRARPAMAVYQLLRSHLGIYPLLTTIGERARGQGITAAAGRTSGGAQSVVLINSDGGRAVTVRVIGTTRRLNRLWWIVPDGRGGASAVRKVELRGASVTLSPWAIAVAETV